MRVSVLTPQELGPDHVSRWHELQRADSRLQSPFLSPEFARAVGQVRPEARVAVLEDGSEVVGFFPFERRRLGAGRPIGSGVSDCQAVVCRPDWQWDARELLRGCGLAALSFDNLVATQTPLSPYHRRLHSSPVIDLRDGFAAYVDERRRLGAGRPIGSGVSDCQAVVCRPDWQWDARELLRGCGLAALSFDNLIAARSPLSRYHRRLHASPVIDLRGGFAAYVAERRQVSRTLVSSTLQQGRRLERAAGPLRVEVETTDTETLRTLLRWKSLQYRRTNAVDRFSVGWIVQLLHDLATSRAPWCASFLSVLYAGDRAVAAHFGLRSPHVVAYWFPAYDIAYGRFSPGRYLLLRIVEAAAERGVGRVDLGRGHEEYKQRFASGNLQVAEGSVERATLAGAAHAAVGLPRVVGVRYVAASPLGPPARRALTAVRRARNNVD